MEENAQPIGLGQVGIRNPISRWSRNTFAALSIRNFRLFYIGQGLSLIGSWMRRTALGWLVYQLTGSMAMLGTVLALSFFPLFFVSPFAGAVADRLDKRKVIVWSQIVAATASALLAILIWTDAIQLWHVMVLAVIGGTAFAFEVPTRQAFVVEMVGRDRLYNAIALNSALVNGTRVIGPAIGGVVMGTIGIGWAFAIDAISYVVVIGTLITMKLPAFTKPTTRRSPWSLMREGVHEVWRNRPVRMVVSLLLITGIFGWSFETLLPAIAQDVLLISETQYGLLFAMFGIGAISGALFTASSSSTTDKTRQLYTGVWLMGTGLVLFTFARHPVLVALTLMLAGFGGILFVATGNTIVQLNVENAIRGRVMGIWALCFGGALPFGSLLAGSVADLIERMPLTAWAEAVPEGAPRSLAMLGAETFDGPASAFLTIGLSGLTLVILSVMVRSRLAIPAGTAPAEQPALVLGKD